MEYSRNTESGLTRKVLAAVGLVVLLGTGCASGQLDPPTPEQVRNEGQYFTLDGVIAANGEPVRCYLYGSDSENTQHSKSWFGFDCDFEGTATFPDEQPSPIG